MSEAEPGTKTRASNVVTRRELFEGIGKTTLAAGLSSLPVAGAAKPTPQVVEPGPPPSRLPGTESFAGEGDLAAQMVVGIHNFLLKQTEASVVNRQALWHRDFTSHANYETSISPNRKRFAKVIGLIDERCTDTSPSIETSVGENSVVALGDGFKIYRARWPVLHGVDGEGLLLQPEGEPLACVVALPDADCSPEMLAGLAPGLAPEAQFARSLAANGCLVLISAIIDRHDTWSGNKKIGKFTNLTHREYIYRMAYEVGRHIIGYEVQKVLAVVDWAHKTHPTRPIGVMGYGEGGLLALYSAAADTRITVAGVSGYFHSSQYLWQEPLYRNIWTLLQEFGDAELAGLIAPRKLIVEASRGPEIAGPPLPREGRPDLAASGRIVSPPVVEVRAEVERAQPVFEKLNVTDQLSFVLSSDGQGQPGAEQFIRAFLQGLGARNSLKRAGRLPRYIQTAIDPSLRLHRQFQQLIDFTQRAVLESELVRNQFWSKADRSSIEKWRQSTESYRRYLWEEVFGKISEPFKPVAAQTRKLYKEAGWTGYEVFLPVWPDVFAYGILLLPGGIKPGERRPVVVCQHGLEGRPQDLIKPDRSVNHYYHRFAATLADHGFVVYCPQNPYIGEDKFRKLQRLANPLKLSLFSFILGQHQQTLDWLSAQAFVDPKRIAFYGLSYGGKTAIRVPPLLDKYALSICSGDFNEWIWKVSRDDAPFSYVFTGEYDMPEFDLGNTFNYSDMANLMTPRPFMVERGHDDGVSIDSWVAYEFAKVRRHYDLLGLSGSSRIAYFNGPHTIHGVETFQFLHHYLDWGEPFS
jgi:dienelactone hydrolase